MAMEDQVDGVLKKMFKDPSLGVVIKLDYGKLVETYGDKLILEEASNGQFYYHLYTDNNTFDKGCVVDCTSTS